MEEGQIVEANRALAEMLLTNGSSLVGRALSGERTAEDEDMLHGLLAGDWGNFRLDRVLTRSDGRTLWARIHVSLFPGDIGGSRQLVATVEDITQQRRMEDHLARTRDAAEAANRAKSAFLANMSHELRTPLNSVIGFTNLLLKNRAGNLTASDLDYLGRVLSNGRHLLELINDVLDLSKIEAGKMVVKPESVDVGALVTDVVRQLEGRVLDRPVRLVADVPAAPLAITADPAMLRQILINLVGNALKFTERGEVAVRVIYDDAGAARIDVEDTGVGIPPDRLGAIFEAFEQADTSTSRRFGGTGLGLTISRRFARAMGFEVAVSSTLNVGSVFAILLRPEAPTPPAPEPRTEPAE